MEIRNRIKQVKKVKAGTLLANPKNWRTHSDAQRSALTGLLADVGFADVLLARKLDDGSLMLIDGHLRAEVAADEMVHVAILDVTEAEADKLLATLDPLAAMAGTNKELLGELVGSIETDNADVAAMLAGLVGDGAAAADAAKNKTAVAFEASVRAEQYGVIVKCADEAEQKVVYAKLRREGYDVRTLSEE